MPMPTVLHARTLLCRRRPGEAASAAELYFSSCRLVGGEIARRTLRSRSGVRVVSSSRLQNQLSFASEVVDMFQAAIDCGRRR